MNREDEICLTLQGLINGIDYETGKVVEFSDKVKDSLKVIAATFECRERCQKISNISESERSKVNDWDIVKGTFQEIVKTIKSDRPNHLVIIQNGYFYDVLGDDVAFFVDRFSYNTYDLNGIIRAGFPIHSEKVFSDLREMKQSFVLVSQLPKEEGKKVRRAISDVYDGNKDNNSSTVKTFNNSPSNNYGGEGGCAQAAPPFIEDENSLEVDIDNPCIDCGCEIPQARIDNVPGVVRCASCQSKFGLFADFNGKRGQMGSLA